MDETTGREQYKRAIVARSLHCRHCGYNLKGVPVNRKCPECGTEIWTTVIATVDPTASAMPQLRDPLGVGGGLFWLMSCQLIATLLVVARPIAAAVDRLTQFAGGPIVDWTPPWLTMAAAAIGLTGLWWIRRLAPPRNATDATGLRRDIRYLGLGLLAWVIAATFLAIELSIGDTAGLLGTGRGFAWSKYVFIMTGAAAFSFLGLRGVFSAIGQRSREYRTSRGGRQRVRDLIAAVIGIGLGETLRLMSDWLNSELLDTIGIMVEAMCLFMLLIGQAYLVLNAWWIRSALRRPAPRLSDVLAMVPEA